MAIRWTAEEIEVVISEAARLRQGGFAGKIVPLVLEAQKVLPKDRQRDIFQKQQIAPPIQARLFELYKPGVRMGNEVAAEAAPPPPPPPPKQAPVPTKDELMSLVGIQFLDHFKGLVHEWLVGAIKDGLERALPVLLENPTVKDYMAPGLRVKPDMPKVTYIPPPQPETMRGPRIAIVGLHPSKQRALYEMVDNLFPLRVWDSETAGGRPDEVVRWSYRTFYRADRASHQTERIIKAGGVWDKVIRVNSERELFDYIDLYVREYKANLKLPAKDVKPTQGA